MASLGEMFGRAAAETFMGLPRWDGGGVPAVLLGVDGCTPCPSVGFYCAVGPAAIRAALATDRRWRFSLAWTPRRASPRRPSPGSCRRATWTGSARASRRKLVVAALGHLARG